MVHIKSDSRQRIINDNIRNFVNPMRKIHRLTGLNKGNKLEHELAKYKKAVELSHEGCEVLIEPILKNGLRPDILVVDTPNPIAYEIVCSETEDSLEKKRKDYPFKFEVIRV